MSADEGIENKYFSYSTIVSKGTATHATIKVSVFNEVVRMHNCLKNPEFLF